MDWMLLPLKRYADFSGRSRRREYWMFALLLVIVTLAAFVLAFTMGDAADEGLGWLPILLFGLFYVAILVPSIAVQVRRFQDQDKTGWLVLLGLIPYVGGLIVLVFMCLPGTIGANRFGPDPKENLADTFR